MPSSRSSLSLCSMRMPMLHRISKTSFPTCYVGHGYDLCRIRLLCVILSVFLLEVVCAHALPRMVFSHVGIEEGMSRATVFDITQDKRGFMWIATNDGLNRFDGYAFRIYRSDGVSRCTIGSDDIRTVVCDFCGRLWIGTDKTLTRYDEPYDRFCSYRVGEKMPVDRIVPIDRNRLMICSEGRLWTFDVSARHFSYDATFQGVTALCKQGGDILIGCARGIFRYRPDRRQALPIMTHELRGRRIQALLARGADLWVATEGGGLYRLNLNTGKSRHFTKDGSGLCSNYVRSLAFDAEGRLWVGTVEGLNIIDQDDTLLSYTANVLNPGSLTQASVRCLYSDRQGGMWVGTYFGGLNYYHPLKNKFNNIRTLPGQNAISNNVIGCMVEDGNRNLWIGTNGGINIYHATTRRYEPITTANGLLSNDIKAIYIDSATGVAYVGSQLGGLGMIRPGSKRAESFVVPGDVPDANSIYAILPDNRRDGLILGTLTGLKRFDMKNHQIMPIPTLQDKLTTEQRKTRVVCRDACNRLWVGTEGGLLIYVAHEGKLRRIFPTSRAHPLGRAFVLCMYESRGGLLWIGTRQGLFKVDPSTWAVRRYTTAHGLPSNIVYGVMQDDEGKMWFSTGYGLCCLDDKNGRTRNYTHEDGIQNNRFMPQAFCQTADGRMLFGGVNGITAFSPAMLSDNPYTPQTVITELRLFNRVVSPDDDTGILSRQIACSKRIVLTHSQSMFSLSFVVPNYIAGMHNTFAYMLEGYDDKWHLTNNSRTASYSRLPHGKYIFKVRAANNDGRWAKTLTRLEVVVLPVWYKTWWARVLFAVALVSMVLLMFRYVLSRKIDKMQLAEERREKQRIQAVNEMKQRFFIDVSHELRTPLTLICSPLQELMDRTDDPRSRQQLGLIGRHVDKLLRLINQLMDYRRAELGMFKLRVAGADLHEVARKVFVLFEKKAAEKNIEYQFISDMQGRRVLCDPGYVEIILNNLLSNAFKYTPAGQRIDVSIGQQTTAPDRVYTIMQVSDTGEGIPKDLQDRVFERFYQADAMHEGSGIGLSLVKRLVELHHGEITLKSCPGMGAEFTVCLPGWAEAYRTEEMALPAEPGGNASVVANIVEDGADPEMQNDIEAEEDADETRAALLIVEDNADISRYLADALCGRYRIVQAGNGKMAMEILAHEVVDLVLTDVMMPEMDGLQLCKRIKQHVQTCHIPVIILSAKVQIQEQLEGLRIGADDYITKPFSISILKAKIHNLLRIRKAAIAHYTHTRQVEPKEIAGNKIDEELLIRALNIVHRHLANADFSTEMFAREMLMSRSNLHIKLKALTGESANDFVKRVRFNKACQLIKEGKLNISEISYMVGFGSPSYFATSFKRRFGCMPSEYRSKAEKDGRA